MKFLVVNPHGTRREFHVAILRRRMKFSKEFQEIDFNFGETLLEKCYFSTRM